MAGFGSRNHRAGKRPSSSSSPSSHFSAIAVVVFLAFCILGLWMLTSSSVVPSHLASSQRASTFRFPSISSSSSYFSPPRRLRTGSSPFDDAAGGLGDQGAEEEEGEGGIREKEGESQEQKEHDEQRVEERLSAGGGGGEEEAEKTEKEEVEDEKAQEGGGVTENNGDERRAEEEQSTSEREVRLEQKGEEGAEEEGRSESGQNSEEEKETNDEGQQQSEEPKVEEVEEKGDQQQQQLDQSENQEEHQEKLELDGEGNMKQSEEDAENGEIKQTTEKESENDGTQDNSSPQQSEDDNEKNQRQDEQETPEESFNGPEETHRKAEEEPNTGEGSETSSNSTSEEKEGDSSAADPIPDGSRKEVSNESDGENRPWATQEDHSDNENGRRKDEPRSGGGGDSGEFGNIVGQNWELCNVTAGPDYIPCLDNEKALKLIHNTGHYEHRERHCPEVGPKCLVPVTEGYRHPIEWPRSRNKIWYKNVPHTKLAVVKGHQNWVQVTGEYLTFPGGGTQFIHGALHYIDFIQKAVPRIAWGKRTRVILDVGCGVASFGGYLFDRDVLTMSFAPKDEHEAQVQFALERGIPAISAVMGTQRLPFPSRVFDVVHCARCRVPWHREGGALLLELNRVLRPGGYFVWSATPVYQKLEEDVGIWKAMSALTKSMCWDLVTIKKDRINSVGAAIYRKPVSNQCYNNRKQQDPPMCKEEDDANAAWYVPLQPCMHRLPIHTSERGTKWPVDWPRRVQIPPYWLNSSQMGIYGKPAPEDFTADFEHWKRVINKSYLNGLGISWSKVRNVMDMRAIYGGFAAALKDLNIWVMNVVNIDSPDTLPIIYERGLFGIYHDWCESFSTYPRTYDLLHADHLFSGLKKRCDILPVVVEVDRILRPGGKFIIRDESSTVSEIENILKSLHWDVRLTFSKAEEGILSAEKSDWRPETYTSSL